MRDLLRKARTPIGVAVIGFGLLAVGGTATAAVVVNSPAADEVSGVSTATTEPVETTAAPQPTAAATTAAPRPVEQPAAQVPAATVGGVTEPTSTPKSPAPLPPGHRLPDMAPGQDPEGVGTIGPDGNYTPAPPRQNPGEPPVGNFGPSGGGDVPDIEPEPDPG